MGAKAHARSLRLEVEGAHCIFDSNLGEALSVQFGPDIEAAIRYRSAAEIVFPDDLVSRLVRWVNLDPVLL